MSRESRAGGSALAVPPAAQAPAPRTVLPDGMAHTCAINWLGRTRAIAALAVLAGVLAGCGSSPEEPGSSDTGVASIPELPPSSPDSLRLTAVGDILLDRGVGDAIEDNGVDSILPVVADQLRRADVAFGNLECPLATVGPRDPWRGIFRADPATVEVLVLGGLDIMSLANNHTLNSGPEALMETLDHLEAAGIGYVGAAREEEHGSDPVFLQARDLRIGFMAYTDLSFPHGSYSKVDPELTRLREQISAAAGDCDLLVVSYHWGEMDRREPTSRQVEVAHASIDAGADAVLGHHPHVLQGVEVYQDRPILYSMGNLAFDARTDEQAESGIFELFYQEGEGWQIWMTPVWIPAWRMGPEYVTGSRRTSILDRFAGLSGDLGANVELTEAWAYVDCADAGPTVVASR